MSTCWMLNMLEVHHYQELAMNALIEEARKEHLLSGIESFVRVFAMSKPKAWADRITYPYQDKPIMLTVIRAESTLQLDVSYNSKIYRRTISV
jgi:hypothetical protein